MPYVCEHCGNRQSFSADARASERRWYNCTGTVNIDPDTDDWDDFEENDSECSDGDGYEDVEFEHVRCDDCDNDATWVESTEEADEIASRSGNNPRSRLVRRPNIVDSYQPTEGIVTQLKYR